MNNPELLIPSSSPGEDGNLPSRILATLNRDYLIVGKTHVRAWQSWLVLGLMVGLASGILWIANQNGQVGRGKAATVSAITVELDIPDYYPEFLRHPQKFFSGQPLKIIVPAFPDQGTVTLTQIATGKQRSLTVRRAERDSGGIAFSLTPPVDLPTSQYNVTFTASGQTYQFQLAINGLTATDKDISSAITFPDLLQRFAVRFRSQICVGYCYWEMVFTGNPANSNELIQTTGLSLGRSSDSGRTWSYDSVDQITSYPYPATSSRGDPKLIALQNGSFLLSGLTDFEIASQSVIIGGGLYAGSQQGGLQFTAFKPVPPNIPPDVWLVADFPKMAVYKSSSTTNVYIAAKSWQNATQNNQPGLFVSHDAGRTFAQYPFTTLGSGSVIYSMTTGSNGQLYAAYYRDASAGGYTLTFVRFTSIEPPITNDVPLPAFTAAMAGKISATSTRAWIGYYGPEIVADASASSPHRGRLYTAWAQEEKIVADPDFEYPYYGYNFDVFVSYSDDQGQTWSPKARVNDDSGAGDQFFPSLRLDANGVLHIAFVDHRNNQDLPVFDIYYAKSRDGVNFSKNLRVNEGPIVNNPSGGRTIGDYLDMVAAYPTQVFIAYPCGQGDYGPTGACMAQIDPRLVLIY